MGQAVVAASVGSHSFFSPLMKGYYMKRSELATAMLIPIDTYSATLEAVTLRKSSTIAGAFHISCTFSVVYGGKVKNVYDLLTTPTSNNFWRFQMYEKALGCRLDDNADVNTTNFAEMLKDMIGTEVSVKIAHETGNAIDPKTGYPYPTKEKISDMQPASNDAAAAVVRRRDSLESTLAPSVLSSTGESASDDDAPF